MDSTVVLSPEKIDEIISRVRNGQVFVYPTDTAYGLGASIKHPSAVKRVFEIKQRDITKTVPLLSTESKIDSLAEVDTPEKKAMEEFLPGPLTLVLSAKDTEQLPNGTVRKGTVAVRIPDQGNLMELLEEIPPITGTSANPAGGRTPYRLEQLDSDLLDKVDFRMDGEAGRKNSSTVAEWDEDSKKWQIIRPGPISLENLNDLGKNMKEGE